MALTPLSHNRDSRLAGSDMDVRGWDVRTDDDEKVGSVDDMLVDDSGRPRYLDVDRGLLRKHVLVPIGQARADDRRDVVWLPGMSKDRFDDVPEWNHDVSSLDRAYEDRLAAAYRPTGTEDVRTERSRSGAGELRELDDLDGYHIPKDETNPKGWTVVTADGREVGEVDELIVDTSAMMVRYLDCDLDQDELGFDTDRERHVLIPLQQVRLDRDEKHVLVDGLTSDRLQDLPVYGGLPLASDFESRMREAFRGGSGGGGRSRDTESESRSSGSSNRYDDDRFDDRRFYGSRLNRGAASMEDEAPSLRDREPMEDAADRTEREQRARAEAADRAAEEREQRAAQAEAEGRARAAEDRQLQADADERRTGDDAERAGGSSRIRPDEEVRIRVRGDEIIVEKRPKE